MSRDVLFDQYRTTLYESLQPSNEISLGAFELNYGPMLPSHRSAAVLDLGCGSGAFLRYLDHKGFENVLGVEISREQIDYCFAAGLSNVLLVDDTRESLRGKIDGYDCLPLSMVEVEMERTP